MTYRTPSFHRPFRPFHFTGLVGFFLLLIAPLLQTLAPLISSASAQDTTPADVVHIIPIRGDIEPGMGQFLTRAIEDAEANDASMIILDINTPGGRLDTVLEMRADILETPIPVVAYVNREAFSAGALITIASDQIWMAPAAVFGAATPVSGATGEASDAKTISAVRSVFRATAEEQGRDPLIAEAMVDQTVVVDGLGSSESLLTLTVEQARERGYLDGIANSRDDLLQQLGAENATVNEASMSFWERAVTWVMSPLVGSVLVLVGMGLIVFDGLVGGFGIAAVVGVLALALFFWGYLLTGLAGWEDLLLIGIGLILILLEVFVIPGFGIAGILGAASLVGGLVLTMTMRDIGDEGFASEAGDVLTTVVLTLSTVILLLAAFLYLLPRLVPSAEGMPRGLQRLSLGATVDDGGNEPRQPGWLVRITGGGEAVERDETGHTAMERERLRRYPQDDEGR